MKTRTALTSWARFFVLSWMAGRFVLRGSCSFCCQTKTARGRPTSSIWQTKVFRPRCPRRLLPCCKTLCWSSGLTRGLSCWWDAGGQALISYLPVFPPALIQKAGDFMPCALFFKLGDIALAVILAFWAAVVEVAADVFFGRGRHIA